MQKNSRIDVPVVSGVPIRSIRSRLAFPWCAVRAGGKKIVAFGSDPAVVDEEMIDGIRSRLQDQCVTRPMLSYFPGQAVRIQQGPLNGLEAVFEREMKGGQRAVLMLKALSYQARLVVDLQGVVNL